MTNYVVEIIEDSAIVSGTEGSIVVEVSAVGNTVVETFGGPPGVQNVYVGDTPPEDPEEGWIWIDTSG